MKNNSEFLVDKYLYPIYSEICCEIFNEEFDILLNRSINESIDFDIATNYIMKQIKVMSIKSIYKYLCEMKRGVWIRKGEKINPLIDISNYLFDIFFDNYMMVEDNVDFILGDEFNEKLRRLIKLGIINEDQEYIQTKEQEING